MDIEIAVETFKEAFTAHQHEVTRIEVCSALDLGGLTPSMALIEMCVFATDVQVYAMIRPRAGHFYYFGNEISEMIRDIQLARQAGAHGVVLGLVTRDLRLNYEGTQLLVNQAKELGLGVTFHRAFDVIENQDPFTVLDQLIDLGVDRVLTSGQQSTAIEGIALIEQLVRRADGRIEIMAGSGVNGTNAKELKETGIDALHFTARKPRYHAPLNMGTEYDPDSEKIEDVLDVLKRNP